MQYYNWKAIHKQHWVAKPAKTNWRTADPLKDFRADWDEGRVKQAEQWLAQNPWCSQRQFRSLVALADAYKQIGPLYQDN